MATDKVIVLCEDQAQDKFIREWLRRCGFNVKHDVRFIAHERAYLDPQNTRCRSWVIEKYPEHVRQIRSRNKRTQCFLVVGIDADGDSLGDILRSLDTLILDDLEGRRNATEGIVILIPRYHIETWAAFFDGQNPNENDDYKKSAGTEEILNNGAKEFALYACGKTPRPQNELPSLTHAFDNECPRIPKR